MDNYTSSERVWLERLNGYPPEYAHRGAEKCPSGAGIVAKAVFKVG